MAYVTVYFMNIALVLAGGIGARAGKEVPKQFLTVYDTPIIFYTLRNIESTNLFDEIYVVCDDGWRDFVLSYAKQYHLKFLKNTIVCGKNRFESMYNGITEIYTNHDADDIIFIIDGNRPLIPQSVFKESIERLNECDGVIALEPCYDSIYIIRNNEKKINRDVNRELLYRGQSPEVVRLKDAYEICLENEKEEAQDIPLISLMLRNGRNVSYVQGSSRSMKITTADDFSIFKSLVKNTK